jgi:hypothetical protein
MSINLNAASARELTQLPRIAADKARKIVHYREVRKGFRDWDEVGRRPGITSADVAAIRTRAWLGPPRIRGWIGTDRRRSGRSPGERTAAPAGIRRRTYGRVRG